MSPDERFAEMKAVLLRGALAGMPDDQLRAEVDRRWGQCDCPCAKAQTHEVTTERDDWKRRAEAAIDPQALLKWGLNPEAVREYASLEDAMSAMGYVLDRSYERGPGIAATKPDTERWGPSDEDLLAEDA